MYNTRNNSLLTDNAMETLFVIKDFPVSMSCIPTTFSNDKVLDMEFQICKKTGIIQLKKYPIFDDMYLTAHNFSIGKMWNDLFDLMTTKTLNIVDKINNPKVLEIGGGSLLLASKILKNNTKIEKYDIFEKNSSLKYSTDERIHLIEEYFDSNTKLSYNPDIIIHSHVLEHVWNPVEFISAIKNISCNYHCFIVPNLQVTFEKKYTNAINFEHNFFITEPYIDTILHNNNFEIIEKEYYLDHSIIYITKYIEKEIIPQSFPNLYDKYYQLAIDFKNYHETIINDFNNKLDNYDGKVYLFGGHIFSQYLIKFGLKTDKIKCILDNSEEKNKCRLYGTILIIEYPEIIKDNEKCAVILKVATYQDEIKKQLYEINKDVVIFE
mgnify:CR=1 FL=1